MMPVDVDWVGVTVLTLVTAGYLLFAAIELAGMTLPDFHTVSYLMHHNQVLRWTLIGAVLAFALWLYWHTGHPIVR